MTTEEQRAAWLESLKPGDEVAVVNRRAFGESSKCVIRRIESVSRIRRTIRISGAGHLFSRRGRCLDYCLQPVTDEIRAYVRRVRLTREIRDFNINDAPIEVLEKLLEVQRTSGVGQAPYSAGLRAKAAHERAVAERRLLEGAGIQEADVLAAPAEDAVK